MITPSAESPLDIDSAAALPSRLWADASNNSHCDGAEMKDPLASILRTLAQPRNPNSYTASRPSFDEARDVVPV